MKFWRRGESRKRLLQEACSLSAMCCHVWRAAKRGSAWVVELGFNRPHASEPLGTAAPRTHLEMSPTLGTLPTTPSTPTQLASQGTIAMPFAVVSPAKSMTTPLATPVATPPAGHAHTMLRLPSWLLEEVVPKQMMEPAQQLPGVPALSKQCVDVAEVVVDEDYNPKMNICTTHLWSCKRTFTPLLIARWHHLLPQREQQNHWMTASLLIGAAGGPT